MISYLSKADDNVDYATNFCKNKKPAVSKFFNICLNNYIRKATALLLNISNGLAERFIKTLKIAISTSAPTNLEELHQCIDIFLLQYRNAVHPSTGRTPAMLFKGRNLRTALNLDSTDVTYYRGNGSQPRRGLLIHQIGSRMYHVLDRDDGSVHRRHIDQINISPTTATESAPFTPEDLPTIPAPMQTELTESPGSTSPAQETQSLPSPIEPKPQLRRSARYRKKPDRYGFV